MAKVKIKEIKERILNIFEKAGVPHEDAVLITDVLTDAQMKGIVTHGYVRVKKYIDCIKSGGIKPAAELKAVVDFPSWALIDGDGGLGIAISCKAAEIATASML